MPRYSSFGALDDQLIDDADLGFVTWNNRLRPDQLKAGQLANSQNGRMGINGEWQTRKGINLVKAPFSVGGSALTLPFTLPTAGQIPTPPTPPTVAVLNDTAVNAVYGSCLFSNPNQTTDAYIIIAGNTKAIAVNLANGNTTDIAYPVAETVSASVSLLQAFNKVFIFRDGDQALEWNGSFSGTPAFTVVAGGVYAQPGLVADSNSTTIIDGLATVDATAHGLKTGDAITIVNGAGVVDDGTVVVVSATPSVNQFNYYITASGASEPNVISAISKASSTVTVTTSNEHGYSTGDHVKISGVAYTGLNNPNGTWQITVTSLTEFTYTLASGAYTFTLSASSLATLASSLKYMKRQSVGLGFCYMPAPPWAVYHQRRLWMPFYYTQTAGPTYTDRGIRDELIVSDILDSDTYDQVYNQYRFNAGTADYVVALHPFADDKLVVFNRNSIHLVVSAPDITQSAIQLITNEVGCLARKSVIQVADNVLFLSDNGIYGTNFQDLYNLRGNGIPLSNSIQATIERINKDYAQNAVAAYFDNRYYIAVPLDGSQTNNALLVYNFLNQGWESIDSVNDSNWEITDLYVGGNGSNRGLYAVNKNGGVHRLEYREDGSDVIITQIGQTTSSVYYVQSTMTTRMFTYGVTDRKRFNNFELQLESEPTLSSDITVTAEGENIDSTVSLGSISSRLGAPLEANEDASIRARIGQNRSYGLQFTLTPTQGRPRIRTIRVSASITNRAITSTK